MVGPLEPPGGTYTNHYLKFDGKVVMTRTEDIGFQAYTQLFRTGIIEYVRVIV